MSEFNRGSQPAPHYEPVAPPQAKEKEKPRTRAEVAAGLVQNYGADGITSLDLAFKNADHIKGEKEPLVNEWGNRVVAERFGSVLNITTDVDGQAKRIGILAKEKKDLIEPLYRSINRNEALAKAVTLLDQIPEGQSLQHVIELFKTESLSELNAKLEQELLKYGIKWQADEVQVPQAPVEAIATPVKQEEKKEKVPLTADEANTEKARLKALIDQINARNAAESEGLPQLPQSDPRLEEDLSYMQMADSDIKDPKKLAKKWFRQYGTKDIAGLIESRAQSEARNKEITDLAWQEVLGLITFNRIPKPAQIDQWIEQRSLKKPVIAILFTRLLATERAEVTRNLDQSIAHYEQLKALGGPYQQATTA